MSKLLTFKHNFPHSLRANNDEANATLIKSNTKSIVEEKVWQIDVIKLTKLINGDIRKCVHESCQTGTSKEVVHLKMTTLKQIINDLYRLI